MSNGWEQTFDSEYGANISIGCNEDIPYIAVEEFGGKIVDAVLPTDPEKLVKLLRAIAAAAGLGGTVVVGRVDR